MYYGDYMKNKIDTSIFLDFNKPLSYNAFLTFIITERGLGKSYGAKKFVAKRFINKHKQFVYLRRYKTELQKAMLFKNAPSFWNQITNDPELKGHKFTNSKDTMSIDGEIAGFGMPLSIANILKSSTYENVDTLIFDEFLIDPSTCYHYLRNEVVGMLETIETVARLRDIRVIFLGNAISISNPYFDYFNLSLPYNSDVKIAKRDNTGQPLIVVYYAKNTAYREVKKQTRFGQLVSDTDYGKYAIDNEMLRDSKTFVRKKTKNSKFYFILYLNNKTYGIWCDYQDGYMFVSNDYDPNCPIIFSITSSDHNENTLLIRCRTSPFFQSMIEHYRLARLCFENQSIKNNVLQELLKYLTL